ncbi:hypothetical protein F511_08744 [Dorcoceras hygrometricum]|uniref:Uncharacterized protein n=1 Tax=Dorcoceras hygrometricum TaxID=472368 RepID=A0A2Z7AMW3_9LAMI|nr:hypothetical protein F511_08744 [Dorcoceras hygrometricum]
MHELLRDRPLYVASSRSSGLDVSHGWSKGTGWTRGWSSRRGSVQWWPEEGGREVEVARRKIEHTEPLGSLGLNGAGDDPVDFILTGEELDLPINEQRRTVAPSRSYSSLTQDFERRLNGSVSTGTQRYESCSIRSLLPSAIGEDKIQQEDFALIFQQSKLQWFQSQRKDFQTQCLSIQSQDDESNASNSSFQSRAYLNQLLLLNQSQALHIQSTWFPGAKN